MELPPQIDTPDLTPEERTGLMIAHEYFVATGDAEWSVIEDEDNG